MIGTLCTSISCEYWLFLVYYWVKKDIESMLLVVINKITNAINIAASFLITVFNYKDQ